MTGNVAGRVASAALQISHCRPRQQVRPDHERVLVDVERRAVVRRGLRARRRRAHRSEEHTSELQSLAYLVCRLLLEKKKNPEKSIARATNEPTPPLLSRTRAPLPPTALQASAPPSRPHFIRFRSAVARARHGRRSRL